MRLHLLIVPTVLAACAACLAQAPAATKPPAARPAGAAAPVPAAPSSKEGEVEPSAPEPAPGAEAAAAEAPADPSERTIDAFLREVAETANGDVAMGQLAMERGASDAVKDLGKRIRANDTAVLVIMGRLAEGRGGKVPSGTTQADDEAVARLSTLQGEAFDKAYATLMAERHATLQSLFRWQYEHCTDEAVKPFVMGTIPAVASHARLSDELNKKVNAEEIRAAEEQAAEERRLAAQKAAEEAAGVASDPKKKRKFTPKK